MLARGFWRAPERMAFVLASREWLRERDLGDHADRVLRGARPSVCSDEQLERDAHDLAASILSCLPPDVRARTEGGSVLMIDLNMRCGDLRVLVSGPLLAPVAEGEEFPTLHVLRARMEPPR